MSRPTLRPRPLLVIATLVAAVLGLLPGVAHATSDQPPTPPPAPRRADPPTTEIVGGDQAGPTQFPFMAALIRREAASRTAGFTCGATVLSRSWILTAAHCVYDYDDGYPDARYGRYVGPTAFRVLTGTSSLAEGSGGQLLDVAAVYGSPSFDLTHFRNDYALLRLRTPTSAPAITVIGSSSAELALDDAGTQQTTAGWGVQAEQGALATDLRYVEIPMQSDATCSQAFPMGQQINGEYYEYWASSMLCAGPLGGGKDSCSGDSGGPLAIKATDDTWRQVGIVSFGIGCAEPGHPGLYSRLSAAASWVGQTRRFGPFDTDGIAFVARQYVDFTGKGPSAERLLYWVDQMKRNPPATLIDALESGSTWQDAAGMVTRLYSAAFLRDPDTGGLAHWITSRRSGHGPVAIADQFASSSEFVTRYGHLGNAAYVDQIYQNVFHRAPDSDGGSYWSGRLASGTSRGQMLYELSNSHEYRTGTADAVRVITTRFALLRQAPTAAELTASLALSQRTLIDTVRTSFRYASRFRG